MHHPPDSLADLKTPALRYMAGSLRVQGERALALAERYEVELARRAALAPVAPADSEKLEPHVRQHLPQHRADVVRGLNGGRLILAAPTPCGLDARWLPHTPSFAQVIR